MQFWSLVVRVCGTETPDPCAHQRLMSPVQRETDAEGSCWSAPVERGGGGGGDVPYAP